jgi:hypothetical protein
MRVDVMSKKKSPTNPPLASAKETVPSDNCSRFMARADELLSQGLDISEVNPILEEEFKTEKLEPISTGPEPRDA